MALEALPNSNELFNFVIYDTISATPCSCQGSSATTTNWLCNENNDSCATNSTKPHHRNLHNNDHQVGALESSLLVSRKLKMGAEEGGEDDKSGLGGGARCDDDYDDNNNEEEQGQGQGHGRMMMRRQPSLGVVVRKKRKRKPRVCKNKEEAETQRMTHIAVERNRRKQMNEHLAVLRSLMPDSYVQRGDQASIVGGAIEFVKELEHLLQSLEAQKLQVLQGMNNNRELVDDDDHNKESCNIDVGSSKFVVQPPFAQFFLYPQYTWSQISNKYTSKTKAAIADIEVTLIETHASLRIFTRRSPRQLSRLIAGFQSLHLTVLHLNVTTLNPLVLYSVSVKVEEACLLSSVDDIAAAVHHMLRIIEEEAAMPMCC